MRLPHLIVLALALTATANVQAATLKPYRDDAELASALQRWRNASLSSARERAHVRPGMAQSMAASAPMVAAAPAADAAGANAAAESITSVQTTGVDEGGIVKRAGAHFDILRRGRLFTLRVGADKLQPISQLDACAPRSDPRGAWYGNAQPIFLGE